MKHILAASCILALAVGETHGFQFADSAGNHRVTVVPGSHYAAGWLHRLLLGEHWRDLWTSPLDADVLDLGSFAGGLTPTKRGGGRQTKSLQFRGLNGKEYKFRSLDKDPRKALPPDLQESIAADLLQDQISSANPLASIIVAPLLNAVGVISASPSVVYIPDDERLGEFRQEFGRTLGTLEDRPNGGSDGEPGFSGAEKIIGTPALFRRLDEDADEHVDAREFLKARLMDIYIGDWDRHQAQWRWAGFRKEDGWLWQPIPTDRDQAFCRLDGVIPWLATQYISEVKGFGEEYPSIEGLTWTGRMLDRRLLASLDREAWDSTTRFIATRLTDSVIDEAVHRLPPGMYRIAGAWLDHALKERRENLPAAAGEFYRLCAQFPEIYGTQKADIAEISRVDPNQVRVTLFRREKHKGEKKGSAYFDRIFSDADTDELRVFLLDGNDRATMTGEGPATIRVIVDGGDGDDEIVNQSSINTKFYDRDPSTTIASGGHTSINRDSSAGLWADSLGFEPRYRDYGHTWLFFPSISFTPDEGVFLGGRECLYDYAFRADPYNYQMTLQASVATRLGKFRAEWQISSTTLIDHAVSSLTVSASQIDRLNFFGSGNETPVDETLLSDGFYKAQQQHYTIGAAIDLPLFPNAHGRVSVALQHQRNDLIDNTFVSRLRPYGSDPSMTLLHVESGFRFDSRDNLVAPSRGFFGLLEGVYSPVALGNKQAYGKLHADARTYLGFGDPAWTTLALRIAGEKVLGVYPFFESAFLGGLGTIRGFEKERFAGDASILGNAELRVRLGQFSILVPGHYGILLLGEAGRVMLEGESSRLWHSALGGGLWLSALNDTFGVSVSVDRSIEKTGVYVTSGFMF